MKKENKKKTEVNTKPRFNIEDYEGDYVMTVENADEDLKFRQYLHTEGRCWNIGKDYIEFLPTLPVECYFFNEGIYCSLVSDVEDNYIILRFKDFEWN